VEGEVEEEGIVSRYFYQTFGSLSGDTAPGSADPTRHPWRTQQIAVSQSARLCLTKRLVECW
jgi:hypothetical protein